MQKSLAELLRRTSGDHTGHWNEEAWRQVVHGPAQSLAHCAEAQNIDEAHSLSMLEAYLTLAKRAVLDGYLLPEGVGRHGFFHHAWTQLIPRLLPLASTDTHGRLMGMLWALGENLETAPPWLEALITAASDDLTSLEDLDEWVADLTLEALEPPTQTLEPEQATITWFDFRHSDWQFLPGEMTFVAPTVLWIGDRHRVDPQQRPLGHGLWLTPGGPRSLGPLPPPEIELDLGEETDPMPIFDKAIGSDRRFTSVFTARANPWCGAAALESSQSIVTLTAAAG
ncbi:MAG: hypothetical protein ACE366_26365 [Bradymonadia bacterium]